MKRDKLNKIKKIKASLKQRVETKFARKGVSSKKGTKVPSSSGMKAQAKWKSMTKAAHPEGRIRKKPGMGGKGRFYRVVVRDKNDFVMFRNHDVGKKGHLERVAGKRANGRWATVSWLIDKNEARISKSKGILVGKTKDVKDILAKLRRKPKHLKGDIFEAGPRINVVEKSKPTVAMKKAQIKNIKKAQAARREK